MSHPRDRPLEPLARALGYRPCRRDKARWTRPGSVISINGPKFYDHLHGCGGGGAIDFVIHATGCTPRQAIAWLASTDHGSQGPRATPAKPLTLPRRCPASWPAVRRWLINERALEPFRVDGFREEGLLYADARDNAVFLCRDASGNATGAELVGTRRLSDGSRFRGMAPGSRKERGGFWFTSCPEQPEIALFIAESAIDALSALSLGAGGTASMYASTAGVARRLPQWLLTLDIVSVACGFDADEAGDAAARQLMAAHKGIRRVRPDGATDWNDILQRHGIHGLIGGTPPDPRWR